MQGNGAEQQGKKKGKKMKKLTPQELLEVLEAHQDMLLGWIRFKDDPDHLVDIESIAVNGNAVQLEVKPFEDEVIEETNDYWAFNRLSVLVTGLECYADGLPFYECFPSPKKKVYGYHPSRSDIKNMINILLTKEQQEELLEY
tara:strand:- start:117 stop:545 length:429 start_codon:yes stop_codon:yes gene_type:complete